MKKIFYTFTLTGFVLLLSACFPSAAKPQKTYTLNTPNASVTQKPLTKSITIEPTNHLPQFANNEFIYRVSKNQYISDYYHIFIQPPAYLINQSLVHYIQSTGLFQHVGSAWLGIDKPQYQLDSVLMSMYADYRQKNKPTAHITLRIRLRKNTQILLDKNYSADTPLTQKSTLALINGWNQGIAQILKSATKGIRTSILTYNKSHPVVKKDKKNN